MPTHISIPILTTYSPLSIIVTRHTHLSCQVTHPISAFKITRFDFFQRALAIRLIPTSHRVLLVIVNGIKFALVFKIILSTLISITDLGTSSPQKIVLAAIVCAVSVAKFVPLQQQIFQHLPTSS